MVMITRRTPDVAPVDRFRKLHFPFCYDGKRHFAELINIGEEGKFRIKQIIPQIKGVDPSPLSINIHQIPTAIRAESNILTLKILDGLQTLIGRRHLSF